MNLGQHLHRLGRKEEAIASFGESRRIFDALKTTESYIQLEFVEGRASHHAQPAFSQGQTSSSRATADG
jgi:hypothetical protein